MFEIGRVYRRRELHSKYGGQEQGGISTPAKYPMVIVFTGDSGELYGYTDHWDDDSIFHYTGEGQIGDMDFVRGNKAVRDHVANNEELYLFTILGNGHVRCEGEMTCVGYDMIDKIPDRLGNPRTAIVFKLIRTNE
jgi:5-methylcytosine-specific restriction protein A